MSSAKFIKVLADLSVGSRSHMMPAKAGWKAPQEGGKEARDNYVNGIGNEKWGGGLQSDGIISYFNTQDPHLYHAGAVASNTLIYKNYIYTMIDAVEYAFNLWKPQLQFQDLKINGPVVVGKKGCLKALTDFEKLFKSYPGHLKLLEGKHFNKWRDAVGKGVASCLKKYIDGVIVPGLPWYPAFTAFPGPVAPPMPNIPCPLIMLPSLGLLDITLPQKLQKAMEKNFDSKIAKKCDEDSDGIHKTVFEAISRSLAVGFTLWVSTQTVNLVMGMGNIPSFAPPVVPVGPVVNGTNIPAPGNLMP